MNYKKTLLLGGAILPLLGVGALFGRRAPIRHAAVGMLRGEESPYYVSVVWRYGRGRRPLSLIIDLETGSGARGSITTDGELLSGDVPLPEAFSGPYTLVATATYRRLGFPSVVVTSHTGSLLSPATKSCRC